MMKNVNNHIKKLNWGYRVQMIEKEIDYFNTYATFVDKNTLKLVGKDGVE